MGDKTAGQWAGAVVGGVIGFFAGGQVVTGALYGASLGAAVGGLLDPPKGPTIKAPSLADGSVQNAQYGAPLIRVHGDCAIQGTIIYVQNNRLRKVVRKEKQGGKGGGGEVKVERTYWYGTFAIAIGDAPAEGIKAVKRVWLGSDLIFNGVSTDFPTALSSYGSNPVSIFSGGLLSAVYASVSGQATPNGRRFRVYPGSDDQPVDPIIQAELGVGNTSAFRGTAYIMFYDLPMEKYGNTLLGCPVKVEYVSDITVNTPLLLDEFVSHLGVASVGAVGCMSPMDSSGVGLIVGSRGSGRYLNRLLPNGSVIETTLPAGASGSVDGWSRTLSYGYKNVSSTVATINGKAFSPGVTLGTTFYSLFYDERILLLNPDTGGAHIYVFSYDTTFQLIDAIKTGYYVYGMSSDEEIVGINTDGLTIATFDVYTLNLSDAFQIASEWPGPSGAELGRLDDMRSTTACVDNGLFYVFDMVSKSLLIIDLESKVEVGRVTLTNTGIIGVNGAGVRLDVRHGIISIFARGASLASPSRIYRYKLEDFDDVHVPLSVIVNNEILRSELIEDSDVNVSDLSSDTVRGYRIAGVQQIRNTIGPLQTAYPFDIIMDGYQLKAVRRGNASVVTIPIEDLDARPYGAQSGIQLGHEREMDAQLPSQVKLRYIDTTREFDQGEQASIARMSSNAVSVREIELPIVFTPTEAAASANVIHSLAWARRDKFAFRLPPTYLNLQPADVITIDAGYTTYELLLLDINYLSDGRLECAAELNDSPAYTQSDTVGGEGVSPDDTVTLPGESVVVLMDIPLIRNDDDAPYFAAGMCGYSPSWPGGALLKSTDNEQTWNSVQQWAAAAVIGYVRETLSANAGYVIDRRNTITVDLISGSLESITEEQMMTGQNWYAWGADGRWEIGRFVNATLNSDGSYTLDTLLRGLRGTEQYTGTHVVSDAFVLLDDEDVIGVGADLQFLNIERHWRAVTSGQAVDSATSQLFAYRGVNLKPLSGVLGGAVQSGSDWVISWEPRSRLYGSLWTTGVDIPIGEATESYQIDIIDGADVVNTYTATTNTYTYTAAQQTTDWGSTQSSITVNVYMISADVGRGYPLEIAA